MGDTTTHDLAVVTTSQPPVPVNDTKLGGGLEGAERNQRETLRWAASRSSPDRLINGVKPEADARGRESFLNDGHAHAAVGVHRDSIVGSNFRLNARPVLPVLRTINPAFDESWAEDFQTTVEARFGLIAESDKRWLDRRRRLTLTDMIRLAVASFCTTGEVCASAEWLNKDKTRPIKTAIQLFSSTRLSNPDNAADTRTLRRGILHDAGGQPLTAYIRNGHPGENYGDVDANTWNAVPFYKPWGRPQILHIVEHFEVDQTRGIADMVAALKTMKMTKQYSEVVLQNAIINASYAAALQSELPPDAVLGSMGGATGPDNFAAAMFAQMDMLRQFFGGANNVTVDGARVPILPPGVKLETKTLGQPGGIGSDFHEALMRHTAATLGLSYEEFSRDYSKVSYSSARVGRGDTGRFMKARKKIVADRTANFAYDLYLEEDIDLGNVPLPRGFSRDDYYLPLVREAISSATWIGAGAGQIDELKETQAAILRIRSGLSTYEIEIARFGGDWREVFAQRAREEGVIEKRALTFGMSTQKPTVAPNEPSEPTEPEDESGADDDGGDAEESAT